MSNSLDGLLLFARYAFMPNRLGFCGNQNERGLFELCTHRQAAPELRDWAKQFEGAYPYLKLIASANHLPDPLAYRVVEAYWLGNELLMGVSVAALYDSLRARFTSRLSPRALNALLGKAPEGARPFHAFHVLDVCRRTGALAESLDTLDSCRISWGQVQGLAGEHLLVAAQPIVFANGKLVLGSAELRSVVRQIEGRGFVDEVSVGDWVSLHWGWACDRLTERQLRHLRQQTLYHLELANQTL